MSETPRPSPSPSSESKAHESKIDPNALAGSKNSLGQESVRGGRPTTDDSVVEAMDEETPVKPDAPNH